MEIGLAVFFAVLLLLVPLFLFWRIFDKAGLAPALALVCLVPVVGYLIALLILALSEWPAVKPAAPSAELLTPQV